MSTVVSSSTSASHCSSSGVATHIRFPELLCFIRHAWRCAGASVECFSRNTYCFLHSGVLRTVRQSVCTEYGTSTPPACLTNFKLDPRHYWVRNAPVTITTMAKGRLTSYGVLLYKKDASSTKYLLGKIPQGESEIANFARCKRWQAPLKRTISRFVK